MSGVERKTDETRIGFPPVAPTEAGAVAEPQAAQLESPQGEEATQMVEAKHEEAPTLEGVLAMIEKSLAALEEKYTAALQEHKDRYSELEKAREMAINLNVMVETNGNGEGLQVTGGVRDAAYMLVRALNEAFEKGFVEVSSEISSMLACRDTFGKELERIALRKAGVRGEMVDEQNSLKIQKLADELVLLDLEKEICDRGNTLVDFVQTKRGEVDTAKQTMERAEKDKETLGALRTRIENVKEEAGEAPDLLGEISRANEAIGAAEGTVSEMMSEILRRIHATLDRFAGDIGFAKGKAEGPENELKVRKSWERDILAAMIVALRIGSLEQLADFVSQIEHNSPGEEFERAVEEFSGATGLARERTTAVLTRMLDTSGDSKTLTEKLEVAARELAAEKERSEAAVALAELKGREASRRAVLQESAQTIAAIQGDLDKARTDIKRLQEELKTAQERKKVVPAGVE